MQTSVLTKVSIPDELARRIADLATQEGRTMNETVAEALEVYLVLDHDYVRAVTEALKDADEGDFASAEEVAATFAGLRT